MARTRRRRPVAALLTLCVVVCLAGVFVWQWFELVSGTPAFSGEETGIMSLDEALARYRGHFAFPPDRRFQVALRDVHRIVTGKAAPVEAKPSSAQPGWDLRVDGHTAGHVSPLPTFDELFGVLVSHAKEAMTTSRVVAGRSKERPQWPNGEFLPDTAFPALASLQADWEGPGRDPDTAERAARLLTGLLLQARTRLDVDDPLAARALAALAVAHALDPNAVKSEECLAAYVLDYSSYCLGFGEADALDPAVHSFISGHVSQLSSLAKATPRGRYLELLLLARTQDPALWRQAAASWSTSARDKAFVLGSALERVTADTSDVPFEVLATSAEAWLGQKPPEESHAWALGLSAKTLRAAQTADARLDGVYLDRDVAFAVEASLLGQALYQALSFPLNVRSSAPEARVLFAALPPGREGLVGELRDWLEHKIDWYEGKDVTAWRQARAADPSFSLGSRGRSALLGDSGWMPRSDEPDTGVRELLFQVLATLDSRPEHRRVALPFVRNRLRDAARADWLETSLARDNQLLAPDSWIAALGRHVGPKAVRSEVLANPIASGITVSALRWLGDATSSPDVGPIFADLWKRPHLRGLAYAPYESYLSGREDYAAAERLAREYLVDPASAPGGLRDVATTDLAASVRLQGRQEEAWQTIEPLLKGETTAYHEGLMALVDLGRYDEAESLGKDALARYPGSVEIRAGIAAARWRAGRDDEAVRAVSPPEATLDDEAFRGAVAEHFWYALRDAPAKSVMEAFEAFARKNESRPRAVALAASFDAHGRHDVAHEMYARLELVGEAWLSLKAAGSEDEATRWVKSLSLGSEAAPRYYAAGAWELLFGAIPEWRPSDSVWLLRAAAVARDPETARRHGAEVRSHFAGEPKSNEQYLARLVLGLDRDAALLAGKLSARELCQVSWALGLAAQGREDLPAAVDFYEVAASTGQSSADCFGYARRQLDEWRRSDVPFDKSWTPKLPDLFVATR
ncbi:MAG TPA: tetratricopeptide repeat protein [Myxococcota bacterium]|nr:tetratricopeptide repeat protein [Myxococcota bacterium]